LPLTEDAIAIALELVWKPAPVAIIPNGHSADV
jgi:hypothetical protein